MSSSNNHTPPQDWNANSDPRSMWDFNADMLSTEAPEFGSTGDPPQWDLNFLGDMQTNTANVLPESQPSVNQGYTGVPMGPSQRDRLPSISDCGLPFTSVPAGPGAVPFPSSNYLTSPGAVSYPPQYPVPPAGPSNAGYVSSQTQYPAPPLLPYNATQVPTHQLAPQFPHQLSTQVSNGPALGSSYQPQFRYPDPTPYAMSTTYFPQPQQSNVNPLDATQGAVQWGEYMQRMEPALTNMFPPSERHPNRRGLPRPGHSLTGNMIQETAFDIGRLPPYVPGSSNAVAEVQRPPSNPTPARQAPQSGDSDDGSDSWINQVSTVGPRILSNNRRDKREGNDKVKAHLVYTVPSERPPNWGYWLPYETLQPSRLLFSYTAEAQWETDVFFNRELLLWYIDNCPRRLIMSVQNYPAQVNCRTDPKRDRICRSADCPVPNHLIKAGFHRVAFDEYYERTSNGTKNPFKVAGSMHLFCFEKLIDCVPLWQAKKFIPEKRDFPSESANPMSLIRDTDKAIIQGAFKPWMKQARAGEIQAFPRDHENSLVYRLTMHHLDSQTGARQSSRTTRNSRKPEADRKTIDIHKGDVELYVSIEHETRNRNRQKAGKPLEDLLIRAPLAHGGPDGRYIAGWPLSAEEHDEAYAQHNIIRAARDQAFLAHQQQVQQRRLQRQQMHNYYQQQPVYVQTQGVPQMHYLNNGTGPALGEAARAYHHPFPDPTSPGNYLDQALSEIRQIQVRPDHTPNPLGPAPVPPMIIPSPDYSIHISEAPDSPPAPVDPTLAALPVDPAMATDLAPQGSQTDSVLQPAPVSSSPSHAQTATAGPSGINPAALSRSATPIKKERGASRFITPMSLEPEEGVDATCDDVPTPTKPEPTEPTTQESAPTEVAPPVRPSIEPAPEEPAQNAADANADAQEQPSRSKKRSHDELVGDDGDDGSLFGSPPPPKRRASF